MLRFGFIYIFLNCFVSLNYAQDSNFYDLIIQMKQIELSVEYNGRYLHVWKENKQNYSRYFVTPLCELITNSVNCSIDDYSPDQRYILNLKLRLWSPMAAEAIKLALSHKGEHPNVNDIFALPMQLIRIGTDKRSNFEIDPQMHYNQHQPKEVLFELYLKDQSFCEKMAIDAKENPGNFLAKTKLYFEFSMMVGKQAFRDVNITGKTLTKSEFFSKLTNDYTNEGIVYLTSSDMNKLSHEIYKSTIAYDERSSDYISSQEEENIIKSLMGIIEDQQISSTVLSQPQWESVFWDDIFTRPDVVNDYYQNVFTYDEGLKGFKFDKDNAKNFYGKLVDKYGREKINSWSGSAGASFLGFGGSASASNSNQENEMKDWLNETIASSKDFYSQDELETFLKQNSVNVKWSGEKFIPKGLDLHRINTKSLLSKGEILYRRVVTTTVPTSQKIFIQPEFVENNDHPISPSFYEELKLQISNLTNKLGQDEEKLSSLEAQIHTRATNDHVQSLETLIHTRATNDHVNSLEAQIHTRATNDHVQHLENRINEQINSNTQHLNDRLNHVDGRLNENRHLIDIINTKLQKTCLVAGGERGVVAYCESIR